MSTVEEFSDAGFKRDLSSWEEEVTSMEILVSKMKLSKD